MEQPAGVVVATRFEASTERIINYLNTHADIVIKALFFETFEDASNHYLSRAWMITPEESEERVICRRLKSPETANSMSRSTGICHGRIRAGWGSSLAAVRCGTHAP